MWCAHAPNDTPFPFKYLPRSLTKYMTEKDEEPEHNLLECGLLAKTRLYCGQGMFISSRSLNSLPSIAIQLSCIKKIMPTMREKWLFLKILLRICHLVILKSFFSSHSSLKGLGLINSYNNFGKIMLIKKCYTIIHSVKTETKTYF